MVQKPPIGSDCKYIQSALLKISRGYKQYGMVVVNTNSSKEILKLHIHILCTYRFMIHICTHIYVNTGHERVFMTKSFLSNTKNKSFNDRVIYLQYDTRQIGRASCHTAIPV